MLRKWRHRHNNVNGGVELTQFTESVTSTGNDALHLGSNSGFFNESISTTNHETVVLDASSQTAQEKQSKATWPTNLKQTTDSNLQQHKHTQVQKSKALGQRKKMSSEVYKVKLQLATGEQEVTSSGEHFGAVILRLCRQKHRLG